MAAAYLAPEPFADRLWNLYLIAVEPHEHGRGMGTALMAHVEGLLRDAGEAVARGFDEEARIRDFYGPGDDKVVFWKNVTV